MDEKYAVRNLQSVLESGRLQPTNFYYTSLTYLPQAVMLAWVQRLVRWSDDPGYTVFAAGKLRPEGYLLCRSVQVVYGVMGLWVVFLLGRRLFSPWIGLGAAWILAVCPAHIRLSAVFKPGILVALLTLLTFSWSLEAVRRPAVLRYLRAGMGVGLAAAAKLNGGAIALPLALGASVRGLRDRRHLLGLALAGLAAAAVFAALNPQLELVLEFFRQNLQRYETRSQQPALEQHSGNGFLGTLLLQARLFLEPGFHGPWIGGAALVGLTALAWRSFRQRRQDPDHALALALLVSFPLAYALIYASLTRLVRPNNFLLLAPFTSLAAAWLLAAGWGWLRQRAEAAGVPRPWTRRITIGTAVVLAVALLNSAQTYAYVSLVPTTWRRALDFTTAQLQPLAGRVVLAEVPAGQLSLRSAAEQAALQRVIALAEVPPAELDRSDAELFAARRFDGPSRDAYARRLLAVPPAAVHRFEPEPFHARGETVVVLLHPRRFRAGPEDSARRRKP
jgi:4-amino-4-deoxy-L-arabinose transferase-like glycosyltransferase